MSFDYGCDLQPFGRGQRKNLLDHINTRINNGADPGIGTPNNIAGAAQVFFDELLKVHHASFRKLLAGIDNWLL